MSQNILPLEGNEGYHQLTQEMNAVIDQINETYDCIINLQGPPLFKNKDFETLRNKVNQVQDSINEWRNNALQFRESPNFYMPQEEHPEIAALHYTGVLSEYIRLIDSHKFLMAWRMVMIDFGMVFKDSNRKWKVAFWTGISIAVVSSLISLIF